MVERKKKEKKERKREKKGRKGKGKRRKETKKERKKERKREKTLPYISSYSAVTYRCKRPLNCCIRSNAVVWEPMHLTPVAKGYCSGLEMQLQRF